MKILLEDAEMDAQLQRTMIAAQAESADLGEALATAARIGESDYDSWYREWAKTAQNSADTAAAALDAGHRVTARQAYLRATEYWRQAIFFIRHDLSDERLLHGWRNHRSCFEAAVALFDSPVDVADVPAAGAQLRTYLFRSGRHGQGPRPVVLVPCGYDSTAEAGYSATAYMALRHGWDCVTFEGPGQGGVLYDQRVPMRPDFDTALTPVLDWVLAQPDIDPARVALIGRSFGGYLAPRGASGDSRIRALVCDPAQFDFVSRIVPRMISENDWRKVLSSDPAMDDQLQQMLEGPHNLEYFGARMATMGAATVGDFLRTQVDYTLDGHTASIQCPVLLTEGEGDFAAQTQVLAAHLTPSPTVHRFTEAQGAGGHCEGLGATAWEEAVFNWLDETLPPAKPAEGKPHGARQETQTP